MMLKILLSTLCLSLSLPFAALEALGVEGAALHFKLDEGEGYSAADTGTEPPAEGLLIGNAKWSRDVPGGRTAALVFEGSGRGAVGAGLVQKLENLDDFTITFWMKVAKFNDRDRIFSTRRAEGGGYLDLQLKGKDTRSVALLLEFQDHARSFRKEAGVAASTAFDASDWVFVAMTREVNQGRVTFHVSSTETAGVFRNVGENTGKSQSAFVNGDAGELTLGSTAATELPRTPQVSISDFRIYRFLLSETELAAVRDEVP